MNTQQLIKLILHRLKETGLSAAQASIRAVGNHYLIRNMQRRGGAPSFEALQALCRVLGLEFYVGPPRTPSAIPHEARASRDTERDAPPPWAGRLREQILQDLTKTLNRPNDLDILDNPLWASLHKLSAAAGEGAGDLGESVAGYIAFTRQWLDRNEFYPPLCTIISVKGDSMEPTLPDGSYILVDRRSPEAKHGRIYVIRTDEGLIVKRLEKRADGGLRLTSDNPAWDPVPWPNRAELVGEVKWMGKLM